MPEPSPAKFHLSLNVSDLERSIAFYRALFGSEPARHYSDYAKFEVEHPPVVLALEPRATDGPGRLNHVGVRVASYEAIDGYRRRLESAGLETQRIENVACCHSHQTKICTFDPDRNLWEIYVLEDETEHAADPGVSIPQVPVAEAKGAVVEHRLGQPLPFADARAGSLGEIRLRGTFNAKLRSDERDAILAETFRLLEPGGRLSLHLMTANRTVDRELPQMPAQAALVRQVPALDELMRATEAAGFVALECKRYGSAPVFRFDGAEMRELLLTGVKPAVAPTGDRTEAVLVYKGPFRAIVDDAGRTFRRGEHAVVDARALAALRETGLIEHFAVLTSDPGCGDCASPS